MTRSRTFVTVYSKKTNAPLVSVFYVGSPNRLELKMVTRGYESAPLEIVVQPASVGSDDPQLELEGKNFTPLGMAKFLLSEIKQYLGA